MRARSVSRRTFIQQALAASAGAAAALKCAPNNLFAAEHLVATNQPSLAARRSEAKVALVSCHSYGPELRPALEQCFDLLGGVGSLVKGKTVAVKLNLTNGDFMQFLGRPVGETFMTHYATALALGSVLFAAGARRVRFVESTPSRAGLETTLTLGDWDVPALTALGKVEFENTRNLGSGKSYAHLRVPSGGHMFSAFDLNQAYEQTDVMVSLAKLKLHLTAGVTLSMKNCFGATPISIYGDGAGYHEPNESPRGGRFMFHTGYRQPSKSAPGENQPGTYRDPGYRVPRIVADIVAARPIHLAIVEGVRTMAGGEGAWVKGVSAVQPGVIVAGLNPVCTDAVAMAVMGFDPMANRGMPPFETCDSTLRLAEEHGIGTRDLSRIEIAGTPIEQARFDFAGRRKERRARLQQARG